MKPEKYGKEMDNIKQIQYYRTNILRTQFEIQYYPNCPVKIQFSRN